MGGDLLVDLFPDTVGQLDLRVGTNASVLLIVGVSAAAWAFLGTFWWFIAMLFKPWRKFDRVDKCYCLSLVSRSQYNVWCLPFGIWYLLFDDNLHLDIVLESDKTAKLLCLISLGYYVYDSLLSMLSFIIFRSVSVKMFVRHTMYTCIFALVIYFNSGYYYAIVGSLLEAVDLPSSLSWLLTHLNMAESKLWKVNQAFLIHLTHCRWVMEFYWFYLTWKHYTSVSTNLPLPLMVVIYCGLLLTTFVDTPYSIMVETDKAFGKSIFVRGKPPPAQTGKAGTPQTPKTKATSSLGQSQVSKEAQLTRDQSASQTALDSPSGATHKGKASSRSRRKKK